MLLLGNKGITIEGISIFADHVDPSQFWYLPGPVSLARRSSDRRAAFTFIKYKPAAVAGGVKGGGFLTFEVNLRLEPELERRILSKLSSISKGRPKLSAVQFDEGTVQCIALNVQGAGGTTSGTAKPGTFNAVEQILGASVPSLQGDNTAAFSLTLSQEGATILEKAFEEGTTPVGVIYDLKFTGMRPALDVKISADYKRVYDQFSTGLTAQAYFVQAGIDAGFEKLVQDGVIKIEVTNYTGDADLKDKEKWALDFFKENLLKEWFQPTLTPGQIAGGIPQPEPLDAVLKRGSATRPPTTPAPARPESTPTAPPKPTPLPTQPQGQPALRINPPVASTAGTQGEQPSPTASTVNPPPSSSVPPVAATDVRLPPSIPGNLPANLGNAQGAPFGVSFKLRFVHQEELKTVSFSYHISEATQRTYAPQGFFGLLVADLQKEGHFVEVDLDDPFFRVFTVTADAPIDFKRIGLQSAQLALDYGDRTDAENNKHADFVFDTEDGKEKKFEVFMNEKHDTDYTYQVQYHFDPTSDWVGEKYSYDLSVQQTEDRTLLLNPYQKLGFLEVRVFPNRIDAGVMDFTEVRLHYEGSNGWKQDQSVIVNSTSAAQFWKLRLSDSKMRSYTYSFVHHLKDGSTQQTLPITTQAAAIPVDDPFPAALNLEFIPLCDPRRTKMVYVDVVYDDMQANNYRREERITFKGDATESVKLRIALIDSTKRSFQYRLTFVGVDNKLHRGVPITEMETLIAVSE